MIFYLSNDPFQNNWIEIRLDAQKFVCETRRAVAERAENIGIWFTILDMLAQFAVITNVSRFAIHVNQYFLNSCFVSGVVDRLHIRIHTEVSLQVRTRLEYARLRQLHPRNIS